jgi:hypothetical protein
MDFLDRLVSTRSFKVLIYPAAMSVFSPALQFSPTRCAIAASVLIQTS